MSENIIFSFGVNASFEGATLKKAFSDSNQIGNSLKELGYKEHHIRVVPEEATPSQLRHLIESNLKPENFARMTFFYYSGFCTFLHDAQGNSLPNLALVTKNIKTPENLADVITLEEILHYYFSMPSQNTCIILDMCLLDAQFKPYPESEAFARVESVAHFLAQFEHHYPLYPRTILLCLSKTPNLRENEMGGIYTQNLIATFQAMHRASMPICPITAHQKARYTFLQNNTFANYFLCEQVYYIGRGYLNFVKEQEIPASPPLQSSASKPAVSEEDMMLAELDDFDIHEETRAKYECEGKKFRDESDLIRNGLRDKTNWKIRVAAAKIAGEAQIEQAVPTLIEMLKETNYMVKRSVAEALGKIGNEAAYEAMKKIARPWPIGDSDEATTKIAQKAVKQIEGKRAEQSGSFGNLKPQSRNL